MDACEDARPLYLEDEMKRLRVRLLAALGSLASFVVVPLTAQSTISDIGALGPAPYQSSAVWAVNDRHQTVGWSETAGFDTDRAIRRDDDQWQNGAMVDQTLPAAHSCYTWGAAEANNARAVIVGCVVTPVGYEPVLWADDVPIPLAGQCGGLQGYAWAINDRGEIAVHGSASPTNGHGGHVWRDGVFHQLEGTGAAHDINNGGVVVGRIFTENGIAHGALWPKALTRLSILGADR
jgi:uncharacterized membrane protein